MILNDNFYYKIKTFNLFAPPFRFLDFSLFSTYFNLAKFSSLPTHSRTEIVFLFPFGYQKCNFLDNCPFMEKTSDYLKIMVENSKIYCYRFAFGFKK